MIYYSLIFHLQHLKEKSIELLTSIKYITDLQLKISLEKNKEKIGTQMEILVEGYEEESFLFFGRSRYDSIGVDSTVYFGACDDIKFGDIVKVKILNASEYDLTGEQIVEY